MINKILSAFKKAEYVEDLRYRTYQEYLKQVSYPAAKDVLNFLIKAEKSHLRFIKKEEERINKGFEVNPSKVKEIEFKPRKRFLKTKMKSIESDLKILESAALLEKADVRFYDNAEKKAKNKKAKEFFNKIKVLEKGHLTIIRNTIKKIKLEKRASVSRNPSQVFSHAVKVKKNL